ncbi:hypothetical protein DEAC_c01590 [Desulfosporosinus acididurans]|uniref:Uncharacterized protein n=1 Tax=Desulfosporosinus acididurans TaxID=476652 RepID=A0A0J1FWG5_9FIRM|nr:hypothetical protein [Desulfosporosinus acididurans]KLU67754.1 hypothetical protein DEAC_c01590 [Desulfosporosinus acididurans]
MKKLRTVAVWTLISLLVQYGGYSYLNHKVQQVIAPVQSPKVITTQLKATIPGSNLQDVQVSYAKDYIAYSEDGTLKVFNLKKKKVVFEKAPPSGNSKSFGVLSYQWLPDRNTLLYFYAKANPNPYTLETVYPTQTQSKTSSSKVQTPSTTEPKTEDPNERANSKTADKSGDKTSNNKTNTNSSTKETTKEQPAKPYVVKHYNNPQLTELYSLDLPDSDDDSTAPDDRFNQTINNFPAGGKIEECVVSTFTNLMYLTVKSEQSELLLEIDVMKNVRTLSKSGETIDNMAASDRYGTLYLDSKVGSKHEVIALNGSKRVVISNNNSDQILGIRDGSVYISEIKNNRLVKIKTTDDLNQVTSNPSLDTLWEGNIPYDDSVRTLIGADGQVIVYSNQTAYIITKGNLSQVKLQGDENYVSVDGAELIQLTKNGDSTQAELQPLKSKE